MLVQLLRNVAASNRCEGRAAVFDGRRRMEFSAATEGVQALVRHVSSAMSDEVEFLQARDHRLGPEPGGLRRPDRVPIRS